MNVALWNIAMRTINFVKTGFNVVKLDVIYGVMNPVAKKVGFWMMIRISFVLNAH